MFIKVLIKVLSIFVITTSAYAKVVTTLPEFAWVAKKLMPKLEVHSLLEGVEDPHFVDASPSFVFKLAKAKVLVLNGLELETGWLPAVIQMSGNKHIQPNAKGYCNASSKVEVIGKIKNFDRSMGDVHALGNPHYTLSLSKMVSAADSIKDCLIKAGYPQKIVSQNFKKLKAKLEALNSELKSKWIPKIFYVYHREFNYLAQEFPIELKQSLEAVPGVLPSANHLMKISKLSKKDQPSKVLAALTAPTKVLKKFKEISGIPFEQLRLHPTRDEDYLEFIAHLHKTLLK